MKGEKLAGHMMEMAKKGAFKDEAPMRKKKRKKKRGLTSEKAKLMLHEGKAQGKALTKKQRGYFGAVAAGKAKK